MQTVSFYQFKEEDRAEWEKANAQLKGYKLVEPFFWPSTPDDLPFDTVERCPRPPDAHV